MTAPKRGLGDLERVFLNYAIETHVRLGRHCRGQAHELLEQETRLRENLEETSPEILAIAARRATHELEAALHDSTLTSIGVSLVLLSAQGYDVAELIPTPHAEPEDPPPPGE